MILDNAVKFNANVAELSKLKVRKFKELIPIFVEGIREKLVGRLF